MKRILLYVFISILLNSPLLANEIKCKKFDLKCKSKKFINETKEFQNEGLKKSKSQINQTKDKVINLRKTKSKKYGGGWF